jgi:hypothetical protein
MTDYTYTLLLDDMKYEVRRQCTLSARIMLTLTCKDEQRRGAGALLDQRPHALLLALVQDKEVQFLCRALSKPGQSTLAPHELEHCVTQTCTHFTCPDGVDHDRCTQCLVWAARTRAPVFILAMMDTESQILANHIVTVEFIRMNSPPLLHWLHAQKRISTVVMLDWDYVNEDTKNLVPDALDWYDALVCMHTLSASGGYHYKTSFAIHMALFSSMVARQWTADQMLMFVVEHMQPELDYICDGETDDVITLVSLISTHQWFLSYASVAFKNVTMFETLWPFVSRRPYWILNVLAQYDDAACSLGRRVITRNLLTPEEVQQLHPAARDYFARVLA